MATRKVARKVRRKTRGPNGPPEETVVVLGAPVVYKLKTRRKKKGSSKASRRLADIENRITKSIRRVSRGVKNGVDEYRDKRDRSQRKRRDGAVLDFCENTARGAARAISESSPVLTDIAKALNTKRLRKQIRQALRPIPLIV